MDMTIRRWWSLTVVTIIVGIVTFSLEACSDESLTTHILENGSVIYFSAEESWQESHSTRSVEQDEVEKPRSLILHGKNGEEVPVAIIYSDQDKQYSSEKTRAGSIDISSFYNTFGVSAYSYEADMTWATGTKRTVMNNLTATKDVSSGKYFVDKNYYWPNNTQKMRFYAYAPCGDNIRINASRELEYTVPIRVEDQSDVTVAATGDISSSAFTSPYALTFAHQLTAIQFATGVLSDCTITDITISGVHGAGRLDMDTHVWTTTDDADKAYSINPNFSSTSSNRNTVITSNTVNRVLTFMMIPQTLPSSATLSITFNTTEGGSKRLTTKLTGTWEYGKTVTYQINPKSVDNVILITPPENFSYNGGTKSFSVMSYSYTSYNTKVAKAWKLKYFNESTQTWTNWPTANGGRNDWLTIPTSSGNGGTTNSNYNATAQAQSSGSTMSNRDRLRNAAHPSDDSSNPYDLSYFDIKGIRTNLQNTANCYVVGAPGWYKIPLVYGNAIKNGLNNISSYMTNNNKEPWKANPTFTFYDAILKNLTDHTDSPISSPFIYSKYTPHDACIVWQDSRLLSNVTLTDLNGSGKYTYIKFYVSQSTIDQGNSIVAVRDASGNIMWSWHIWVTDRDIYSSVPIVNHEGLRINIMAVPLGWSAINSFDLIYPSRNMRVRFCHTSDESIYSELTIMQNSGGETGAKGGDAPFYQWGRKDPMLPGNGFMSKEDKIYDAETSTYTWNIETGSVGSFPISKGIKQPYTFLGCGAYFTQDYYYVNLWNINALDRETDMAITKTVYDPCPVGFHAPRQNFFTGFLIEYPPGEENTFNCGGDGAHDGNLTRYANIDLTTDQETLAKGFYFYTHPNRTGDKIFLPRMGIRHSLTGSLNNPWTLTGNSWKANAGKEIQYHWDHTDENGIQWGNCRPFSGGGQCYGEPLLPEAETE